jgi:hypothetical protein
MIVKRGATVSVQVTGGPGNRLDWLGLFHTSAADIDHLAYRFMNGTTQPPAQGITTATVTFKMPTVRGRYNFRFFKNATHAKLATSQTVFVY